MPFSERYPDLSLHLWTSSPSFEVVQQDEKEIAAWRASLALENVDVLYIYGLGLGYYFAPVKEWLAKNQRRQLVFLEDDLAVFAAFSQMPHAQEIIDHPQVHLKWISTPSEWDFALEWFAALFSTDKIEVSALKSYEKSPRFRKIKLALLRKSVLWHSATGESLTSHLLHQNIVPNLRRIPSCFYVNRWKDAWKGVPAIICGAGPSLKKVAPALLKARDQVLMIGCGSALSALAHLGIRPHLGMAIDPNAREFDCLKGCTYRDLPLLFGSRLCAQVFELFDGPFGYIRSGSSTPLERFVEEKLELTDPSLGLDLGREALSVTTLALSLAHDWGCNPIIFAGVDLAYDQEQHYAEGVFAAPILDKRAGEYLLHRKNKLTSTKWIMEQETIDNYAKSHPATTFLNTSGGLGFKNIPNVSLEKIDLYHPRLKSSLLDGAKAPRIDDRKRASIRSIQTRLRSSILGNFRASPKGCFSTEDGISPANYDLKVAQLIAKTKMKISRDQIEEILQPLAKSLEKCLELILLLEHEDGGKAVLYEMELEEEPAYQLFLEAPRRHFERLQPNSDKWKYLEEVLKENRAAICSVASAR